MTKDTRVAYTLIDLANEVLQKAELPMSAEEIWNKACEMGLTNRFKSQNPKKTLGITLARNLEDKDTPFEIVADRPKRFWLKERKGELQTDVIQEKINRQEERDEQEGDDETDSCRGFNERDLHPLVVSFARKDFGFYCRTIHHEKSLKRKKRYNMWLHPDIVGVSYYLEKYKSNTFEFIKNQKESLCKIISFELKIEINPSNLKKCYFQAVSNSSWANEGYLVALHYKDYENDLSEEMERLKDAFGIGFLKINLEEKCLDVLYQAKEKEALDYNTINRLVREENEDFDNFIKSVNHNLKISDSKYIIEKDYDEVYDDDGKMEKYIKDKKII